MDIFVARQPIFDKHLQVFGYELLYRDGLENACRAVDGDQATMAVIRNTLMVFGAETLSGGKKAFVNFTANLLANEAPFFLPKDLAVLEILENVAGDPPTLAACRRLRQQGYPLALDDFIWPDHLHNPLVEVVDIIKVDLPSTSPTARREIAAHFSSHSVKLLAEKTETRSDFQEVLDLGFAYFQGNFFSTPKIIARKDIPGYKLNYLGLLRELSRRSLDYEGLRKVIERDPSLTFKLLKYLNSAFFALRREVTSIKHALELLGEQEIRKWASLVVLMQLGKDQPRELIRACLLRARFCETLALQVGLDSEKSELFLMGMFSLMDVFLGRPLEELLEDLPFSGKLREALLGHDNPYRPVFQLVCHYEKGAWQQVRQLAGQLRLNDSALPLHYAEAIKWLESPFWF